MGRCFWKDDDEEEVDDDDVMKEGTPKKIFRMSAIVLLKKRSPYQIIYVLFLPTKLSCIISFSFFAERRLARLTLSANTILLLLLLFLLSY